MADIVYVCTECDQVFHTLWNAENHLYDIHGEDDR